MPVATLAASRLDVHPMRAVCDLGEAVAHLAQGGLVAFPTETVWGLAACARSRAAMAALLGWKGRGADQPVAVLVAEATALSAAGFEPSATARRLIRAFWPGPLTLVLPARAQLAPGVARADGAVGVRCSSHPLAAALAAAAERAGLGPLTATSLNRSGEPPARDEAAARALCTGEAAPLVLDSTGRDAWGEAPSSVLDLTCEPPRLLRKGAIDEAALRERAGLEVSGAPAAAEPLANASQGEKTP